MEFRPSNAVRLSRYKGKQEYTGEAKIDHLVCLSIAHATRLFPLSMARDWSSYTTEALLELWQERETAARAWLIWMLPRRPKLQRIFDDCQGEAESRLRLLAYSRMLLHKALEREDDAGRINLIQLLACDPMLYKKFL